MRRPSRWIFALLALSLTTAAGLAIRASIKSHNARAAADKAMAEEIMASHVASPLPVPSPTAATSPQATPLLVAPPKTPEATARPAPAAKPQGKPMNSVATSHNPAQLTDSPTSAKALTAFTTVAGQALPSADAKQPVKIAVDATSIKAEDLRETFQVISVQSGGATFRTSFRMVQPEVLVGGGRLIVHVSKQSDMNGDDTIDNDDYLAFTEAFSRGDPSADFNHDGSIDLFDFRDFTAAFEAGR